MQANYNKYLEIWTAYYKKNVFAGGSLEAAAAYAAMDCMNVVKGWSQSEIDDDIEYWKQKI